jgi:hypothetical protein
MQPAMVNAMNTADALFQVFVIVPFLSARPASKTKAPNPKFARLIAASQLSLYHITSLSFCI